MRVDVACDPGMDGAIVFVRNGVAVRIFDMPTTTLERRSKGKTRKLRSIDTDEAARLIGLAIDYCAPHETPVVTIEKVQGRQGEGAGSSFRFGQCYGALCAVPASLGWVWGVITPQTWKPAVGLPTGATKDDSLELARQLYPDAADMLTRKKDHGRADALLIAHARTQLMEDAA